MSRKTLDRETGEGNGARSAEGGGEGRERSGGGASGERTREAGPVREARRCET